MTHATRERADLADLLETLTEEQWQTQSLCSDWTVRDVVAHHLSYDELTWSGTLKRVARGKFGLNGTNAVGVQEDTRGPRELIDLLRAHLRPRGLVTAFGGMVALLDCMIHQQDIRRPLGIPREIPRERLRIALGLAMKAPPIRAFVRARGLRLVATDVDWTRGSGPEVRGPGEAMLMAVAGRGVALDELSGPGTAKLAARM
ncbi:maleylpyruvate isomerase family mycothiol-dependent enzyme [Kibdelosporangium aridum]|uniref:Maleylpyruvate isomerase family mycothiol-dependent enzyme n=1 Tax=Kibdelosporangium aridum TaxID=2030 RepID=A0A428ZK75_KIBAR|nr:maleylpyruvate isomerase family mycothiol-dependent enzyme [Kibdelosporangium aridum]RSM88499.1 maleylpyruvate isomerase family mycothiol-dependent enzyme [Kibdelosporangium aridum]